MLEQARFWDPRHLHQLHMQPSEQGDTVWTAGIILAPDDQHHRPGGPAMRGAALPVQLDARLGERARGLKRDREAIAPDVRPRIALQCPGLQSRQHPGAEDGRGRVLIVQSHLSDQRSTADARWVVPGRQWPAGVQPAPAGCERPRKDVGGDTLCIGRGVRDDLVAQTQALEHQQSADHAVLLDPDLALQNCFDVVLMPAHGAGPAPSRCVDGTANPGPAGRKTAPITLVQNSPGLRMTVSRTPSSSNHSRRQQPTPVEIALSLL